MKRLLLALVVFLVSNVTPTSAHKYPADSYGCHNNTTLAAYECHTGQFAGRSWPNPGGKTKMLVELNTPPPPPPPPPPPVCPDPVVCPVCPAPSIPVAPVAVIATQQIGVILQWEAVTHPQPVVYEVSFFARDPRDPLPTQQEQDRISHISRTGSVTSVYLGSILQDMLYEFKVRTVAPGGVSPWSNTVIYKGVALP